MLRFNGDVVVANREMVRVLGAPVNGWTSFPSTVADAVGAMPELSPASPRLCVPLDNVMWTLTHVDDTGWLVQAEDQTVVGGIRASARLAEQRLDTIAQLQRYFIHSDFDPDLRATVEMILDHAKTVIDAPAIAVGRIEDENVTYWVATAPHMVGIQTPLADSVTGIAISSGETVVCNDTENDPRVHTAATRAAGVRSMVIAPLWHRGLVVGVLNVLTPRVNAFQATDVATIELVASVISVAYGHATDLVTKQAQLDEMEHAATHDPLTGLPNRALFHQRLARVMHNPSATRPAVLFVDLDYFKQINDTLGHDAGDVLLCEVAGRLRDCVRGSDFAARLGGDEFVVLAHGVIALADLDELARRVSIAIHEPMILAGQELRPGASIGAALSIGASDSPERILRSADEAVYEAKRQGRGRYCLSRDDIGS
jgi:diguanylate cyclase (GGDEF)-like protein